MRRRTPGPWEIDDPGESGRGMVEGIMIIAPEALSGLKLVAECLSPARAAADARLIAAAPDLLEALQGVMYSLEDDPADPEWNEEVRACRAAIAKATGEVPHA